MNRRFRYIFLQMLSPFLVAGLILMVLLYFINIPRLLDVLLVQGSAQDGTMNLLFLLLLLILPKILAYILPVALLAASLYVLYRLHADNERIALQAGGLSYWAIARPLLSFACIIALLVFSLHAWFMPLGQRSFQSRVLEIHENITAAVLRPGEFNAIGNRVTTFVRSRDDNGVMRDILVQDARDPDRPIVYLAARGQLLLAEEGPRLQMFDGSIQRLERPNDPASLNILRFDRYVYNLSDLREQSANRQFGSKERFLSQLLYPHTDDKFASSRLIDFLVDGHNRLAVPLFCFAYVLIALAVFRDPNPLYGGYFAQIAIAISLSLAVRLIYIGATGLSREHPALIVSLYLMPLGASLLSALFIACASRRLFSLPRIRATAPAP